MRPFSLLRWFPLPVSNGSAVLCYPPCAVQSAAATLVSL
jgi:hypothetical protein